MNELNAQNAVLQGKIALSTAQSEQLAAQIADAQAKMEEQKTTLAANLKSMYLDSGVTPLEMIASSNNLSDFFNQQQYQDSIKNKIQSSLETILKLKAQLESQQQQVAAILADQRNQAAQIQANRAEVARLAAIANQSAAVADQQVQQSNSQAAALHAQQAAINAERLRAAGGGHFVASGSCGGGYPNLWCGAPRDTMVDDWGMYNRECVSYAAFKVSNSRRNMPYWGGRGNAKQWPDNARAAGIPVNNTPRAGDVAIATAGTYGHAAYVDSINNDGSINVSQYNYRVDGNFSVMTVSPSFFDAYIHF